MILQLQKAHSHFAVTRNFFLHVETSLILARKNVEMTSLMAKKFWMLSTISGAVICRGATTGAVLDTCRAAGRGARGAAWGVAGKGWWMG